MVGGRIKQAAHSVAESLRRDAHSASNLISNAADNIGDDIKNSLTQVASALDLITPQGPTEGTVVDSKTGMTSEEYVNSGPPALSRATDKLHELAKEAEGSVSSVFHGVADDIKNAVSPIGDAIGDVHEGIADVGNKIGDVFHEVVSGVTSIPNKISNGITGAEDGIVNAYDAVKTKIQVIKGDIEQPIRQFRNDVINDLKYVLFFGGIAAIFLWKNTGTLRGEIYQGAKYAGKRAFNEMRTIAPKAATAALLL